VEVHEGGCWYCHKKIDPLVFSFEFDTYFHPKCLEKRLAENPKDIEAKIMMREYQYD
jgi:hypothetical protein